MPKRYDRRSVLVFDGFLSGDLVRDVYCASDFVLNDAAEYLTSAVVRTAMEYARPVIARETGCTRDMARGAAVWIDRHGGLAEAIAQALALPSEQYARLSESAAARNRERQWDGTAGVLSDLYEGLIPA